MIDTILYLIIGLTVAIVFTLSLLLLVKSIVRMEIIKAELELLDVIEEAVKECKVKK